MVSSVWVFWSLILFTADEKLLHQNENRSLTQPLLNLLTEKSWFISTKCLLVNLYSLLLADVHIHFRTSFVASLISLIINKNK